MPIRGAFQSDLGKVRTKNEDSYGFFPDKSFYVVADGMGGHVGGAVASALAVETMLHSLVHSQYEDLTPLIDHEGRICVGSRRLLLAVQQANGAILEKSRQETGLIGMGTTVAAVLFEHQDSLANICHVGDSRVYHVRNGYIEQLTEDHSFVQQLFQEGKLSREEMKVSPHRHILTQAVGIGPLLHPALATSPTQPGDLFILCSDGLHGVVSKDEILQTVLSHPRDLQQACDELVHLANDRGGPDNCTVVLLHCEDAPYEGEEQTLSGE